MELNKMKISITKQEMDLAMARINANTFIGKYSQQKSNEAWGLPIFSKLTFDKPADLWKDERIKDAITAVKLYAKKNDYTFATPDQIKHNEATFLSKLFNDADDMAKGYVAVAANPKIEGHDGINFFTTMVSLKTRRSAGQALVTTGIIDGALIGFFTSLGFVGGAAIGGLAALLIMCAIKHGVYSVHIPFLTPDEKIKWVPFGIFNVSGKLPDGEVPVENSKESFDGLSFFETDIEGGYSSESYNVDTQDSSSSNSNESYVFDFDVVKEATNSVKNAVPDNINIDESASFEELDNDYRLTDEQLFNSLM
jgi:hypothetical protein